MNERNGRDGEDAAGSRPAGPAAPGGQERVASVGAYLAVQRRMRRISLDELADRTRIPRRNLERLEAGAFDAVPDGFSRGFVRSVADALGLDPDEAVMHLMREPPADDPVSAGRRRRRVLLFRTVAAVVALVALLLLLRLALAMLAPLTKSGVAPIEPVYRRDAVRALAEDGREGRFTRPRAAPEPLERDPAAAPDPSDGREPSAGD